MQVWSSIAEWAVVQCTVKAAQKKARRNQRRSIIKVHRSLSLLTRRHGEAITTDQ